MEKSILGFICCLISFTVLAQESPREFEYTEGDTTYTMKQYVFCLYLSGTERSQSDSEAAKIQQAHMAHLSSLEEQGLQLAGPFGDESEKRGVLLFDIEGVEAAERLIAEDPAVKANRLTFECHPLWLAKGTTLK